ncbi:hypothetical protein DFS34DRAFT_207148 [Phlyctochytrium arcticum]|nr:hypothetical protein DFS34DRAFT_207148 [Phlyctochytrium arcticum]
MHRINLIQALLLVALAVQAACEPITVDLLHRLQDNTYTRRGQINYDPTSNKRSAQKYEPDSPTSEFVSDVSLTDKSVLYQVKLVGPGISGELFKTVPACLLKASGFVELITLHLNDEGDVWTFDYQVNGFDCDGSSRVSKNARVSLFTLIGHVQRAGRAPRTQVQIERAVAGPRPVLEEIVNHNTPDGKPPPEKSFIQKYWYYLLPIMVILLMGGGDDKK